MKQQGQFVALPVIAVADGAISPDPGDGYCWAFSTVTGGPVYWDGSTWNMPSSGSGGGSSGLSSIGDQVTLIQPTWFGLTGVTEYTDIPGITYDVPLSPSDYTAYVMEVYVKFSGSTASGLIGLNFVHSGGNLSGVEYVMPTSSTANSIIRSNPATPGSVNLPIYADFWIKAMVGVVLAAGSGTVNLKMQARGANAAANLTIAGAFGRIIKTSPY